MKNIFFKDNIDQLYFFDIPNIPKSPIINVPNINSIATLKDFGINPGTYRSFITKNFFRVVGFKSFLENLPNELEYILKKTNLRLPGLFAPVISASLSLTDDEKRNNIIDRSVSLILAVYDLYFDIAEGKIIPDKYKDEILEMGQYPNLFSTSLRIFKNKAIVNHYKQIDKILVICRNKFYLLKLEDITEHDIYSKLHNSLSEILEDSSKHPLQNDELSIGHLTACNNNTQFSTIRIIKKNKENLKSLNKLYQAFFTICLEPDSYPKDHADLLFQTQSNNYGNRWFHSSLQLVIFGNAKASIICNFTVGLDGNVMMRAGSEIGKRGSFINPKINSNKSFTFEEIKTNLKNIKYFKLDNDIKLIRDNQQATFEIDNFGTNFFQKYNLSPVQSFVVALQLSLKELMRQKRVRITQFISMNKYRYMDLDQVNVSTDQVFNFIDALDNEKMSKETKLKLFNEAIDSQKDVVRKARSCLNLNYAFILFIKTRKKITEIFLIFFAMLASLLMGRNRIFDMPQREVIISQPKIFPEVQSVGRPGIRIPYAKYFGLHYQIWDEKIVITIMPGINWSIPNKEIIRILQKNLQKIEQLFSS